MVANILMLANVVGMILAVVVLLDETVESPMFRFLARVMFFLALCNYLHDLDGVVGVMAAV